MFSKVIFVMVFMVIMTPEKKHIFVMFKECRSSDTDPIRFLSDGGEIRSRIKVLFLVIGQLRKITFFRSSNKKIEKG